jgi:hypothetical protein
VCLEFRQNGELYLISVGGAKSRNDPMGRFVLFILFGYGITAFAGPSDIDLLNLLASTSTGQSLVIDSKKHHITITFDRVSKTEIQLEQINDALKVSSAIQVDSKKSIPFQMMDLAHELVHATQATLNPFDPELTALQYIQDGMNGAGGERIAIETECRVGMEWVMLQELNVRDHQQSSQFQKDKVAILKRCESITVNPSATHLNHLGKYKQVFLKKLDRLQSGVSPESRTIQKQSWSNAEPKFISASTELPYPLALLNEYEHITQRLCAKNGGQTLWASRCQFILKDKEAVASLE